MKKKYVLTVVTGIVLGILLSFTLCLAGMDMGDGSMKMMGKKKMKMGKKEMGEHIKTVKQGGLVFNFNLIDMKEKMKKMGNMGMKMDMGGMTHHLMVFVEEESGGKKITDAKVKYKIFAPDGSDTQTMTMAMGDGYGADVSLPKKGEYGIVCMVKIGDKKEVVKFNYEVK